MSEPINPKDPSLPQAWRRQPNYWLEVATLVQDKPEAWEETDSQLERLYYGWYLSHDHQVESFDPLDAAETPQQYAEAFSQMDMLLPRSLEAALYAARDHFNKHDFRKAEGLAKLFAGRSGGYLTIEQRQDLVRQISATQPSGKVLHKAFLELEGGYAVAGVIALEESYPYYATAFASEINPILTLVGREVVVCQDGDTDTPIAKGRLELHGNFLELTGWQHLPGETEVGGWGHDFTDAGVEGVPFEEVELSGDDYTYSIIDRDFYQETYVEEEL